MTNETPENQPTPPAGGQHDFGAHLSSTPEAPAEPTDAAPADATGEAPAAPAPPTPEAPAGPTGAPAVDPTASVADPAAPHLNPTGPVPGDQTATPASPYPGAPAGYPGPDAAQPYPGADAAQPYPGADATQPYPGADAPQPYPGAAAPYPAAAYDPNAPAYDPNAPAYDPNAPAHPAQPAPKKPMSKGLLWGLIGGGVLLILLIVAAIVVPLIIKGAQPTASDAAEAYMQAVADGDAEAAMEYIETLGTTELLTDEVLQKSIELAPIADVEIGEPTTDEGSHQVIPVTFTVGGEEVSRDFDVYRMEEGWKVDGLVAAGIYSDVKDAGLMINGVPIVDDAFVFPGTYEFSIDNDMLALGGESNTFRLITNEDNTVLMDLEAVPTDAGIETFRTLVTAAVEECVAMKTLSTPCGMDITDIDLSGATPIEGSVTRTLTDDGKAALAALEVTISEGGVVRSSDSIDVDITLEGDNDGKRYEYEVWLGGWLNTPTVDLLAENPEVVWE